MDPPSDRTGAVVRRQLRELVAGWLQRGMREGTNAPAGGWNQSNLAERSGVSRQHINGIINKTSEPGDDILDRLAATMGYALPRLVWEDDAPAYDRGKLEGWRLALRWVQGWSEAAERAGPSLATTPAELSAGRSSGEVRLADAGLVEHFARATVPPPPESPSARTAGPADAGTAPPKTPAQTPKRGKRAG